MSSRVGPQFVRFCLVSLFLALLPVRQAAAQVCPPDRFCFYVPPGLPIEGSHSVVASRQFDIVLSSPARTITGSYAVAGTDRMPFSVSPGSSVRIPLTGLQGPAAAYGVAEQNGVFLVADSEDLTVDHRETYGEEQYSETIKRSAIALGSRFRLGGYSLDREGHPDAGVDAVLIYAPTGGTVTLTAPPGATLPFWSGSVTATTTTTLTAGQTLAVRTLIGLDLDGALLTSSAPVAVSSGGRGWSAGACGDDGMDGLVPVSALGTEYVVRLPSGSDPQNNESRVRVIADEAGTEVRVNGTLVATLAAGAAYSFQPSTLSHIRTSRPALVWMNGSLNGCELDTVLIPPIAFAPALSQLSLDFNVLPSEQTPPGELAILILTSAVPSIRLNGQVPTFSSNETVPERPDLSYVRFDVAAGDQNVSAESDFQALLASRTRPSGLLAYYNPFRIPGCGDSINDAGEGCDDGNLRGGDGCSSVCQVEPGTVCTGTPSVCGPACGNAVVSAGEESCDDGNVVSADGCSNLCRLEVSIDTPVDGSVTRESRPTVSGRADPEALVTVGIGDVMGSVRADTTGSWSFTPPSALADGFRTITATAIDVSGGSSSAMRGISIDASTRVSLEAPSAGAVLTSATPELGGSGEPGARVEVVIDNRVVDTLTVDNDGRWSVMLTVPLAAGGHDVTLRTTDPAGNMASGSGSFSVLLPSADLFILNPPDRAHVQDPRPPLTGFAAPGAYVAVSIDDVLLGSFRSTASGSWSVSLLSPLPEGEHVLWASTTDASSLTMDDVHTFVVDPSVPPLSLDQPTQGSVTSDATPSITGSSAPNLTVRVLIDGMEIGTAPVGGDGRWSLQVPSLLADGRHAAHASVAKEGLAAEAQVGFRVDTRTAVRIIVPARAALVGSARPGFAGTAEPGAMLLITVDGVALEPIEARVDGSWYVTGTTALTPGEHVVRARATDPLGNEATDETTFRFDPSRSDSDGDGLSDDEECAAAPCPDTDGDGLPDSLDADDDGDGIPSVLECWSTPCRDSDEDGRPDVRDSDDDNDGRPTREELAADGKPRDSDGDGRADHLDPDDDHDGLSTASECTAAPCPDTDGDGLPDYLDADDDGDGLSTARERGDGQRFGNDVDGDGFVNWLDDDANENRVVDETDGLADRDDDRVPDYIDLDVETPDGLKVPDDGYEVAGGAGCDTSGQTPNGMAKTLLSMLVALVLRRRRS